MMGVFFPCPQHPALGPLECSPDAWSREGRCRVKTALGQTAQQLTLAQRLPHPAQARVYQTLSTGRPISSPQQFYREVPAPPFHR